MELNQVPNQSDQSVAAAVNRHGFVLARIDPIYLQAAGPDTPADILDMPKTIQ